MNRLSCLAGFLVLCSFSTPAQAFAGGNPFMGKKFVVNHHKPIHFVPQQKFFVPTPIVHKKFVAPPFFIHQPTFVFPHQHFGVIHHGVPFGGHGVIILK
ncbi:MAG TPA: hypothetical protein VFG20_00125 [Planctomycetaceae bacterium]|nr:hypothetical protein [Planctomycetaceae bacterium]